MPAKSISFSKTPPPHIRAQDSVPAIMWTAVLALFPILTVFSFFSGFDVLRKATLAVTASLLGEIGARKIFGRSSTLYDGSAVVTAVLLSLLLPAGTASWQVVLSSLFAIFFGKEIFGGLGQNPFNPALVGVAFWAVMVPSNGNFWPASSETLQGSISSAAVLAGGAVLLFRRIIYWEPPFLFVGAVTAFSWAMGRHGAAALTDPVILLAAFFIVTDPVTTPVTRQGVRWFAIGGGLLAAVIRQWGSSVEAVTYGTLVMNACAHEIDFWLRPRGMRPR